LNKTTIIKDYYFFKDEILVVMVMVFNTTLSNISVISWQSVLLVEETGVHGENHWPFTSHWQPLSHNVVSSRKGIITEITDGVNVLQLW